MNKDNKKRKLALGAVVAAGVTTGAMAATPSPDAPKQDGNPEVELTAADEVRIDGQSVDFDDVLAQIPPRVRDNQVRLMYGVRRPKVYGGPPRRPKQPSQSPDTTTIYGSVIDLVAKKANLNPWMVQPMSNLTTDLGLDSLGVVELLIDVEKKFNVVIPEETVNSIKTVKDIIDFVSSSKANPKEQPKDFLELE